MSPFTPLISIVLPAGSFQLQWKSSPERDSEYRAPWRRLASAGSAIRAIVAAAASSQASAKARHRADFTSSEKVIGHPPWS